MAGVSEASVTEPWLTLSLLVYLNTEGSVSAEELNPTQLPLPSLAQQENAECMILVLKNDQEF